jgi:uncharacterized protein (TIRG00374 family)
VSGEGKRRRGAGIVLVLACVLLGALVAAMDGQKALHIIRHARWEILPAAVLVTAISYLCLSAGYASINRIFGIRLPTIDLIEISFVSFALNNLISVGGLAGYSLRLVLLRRRGLSTGDVLGASLVHSYFNHIVMMSLLPLGLIYILLNHPLGRDQTVRVAAAAAASLLILFAITAMLLSTRLRGAAVRLLAGLGRRLLHREFEPPLSRLDETLGGGIAAIRAHPGVLRVPLLLVLADWAASILALGLCFDALGDRLHAGVLLTGFSIGVTVGFLSMMPGGMGVQEGSMTGVYVLLGVQLEHAVLAAMLFRIVYYVVPFAVSLALYTRLLRSPGERAAAGP